MVMVGSLQWLWPGRNGNGPVHVVETKCKAPGWQQDIFVPAGPDAHPTAGFAPWTAGQDCSKWGGGAGHDCRPAAAADHGRINQFPVDEKA